MENLTKKTFYIGQTLYQSNRAGYKFLTEEYKIYKVLKTKIFIKNEFGDTYEVKIKKRLRCSSMYGDFFTLREDALLENKKRFFENEINSSFEGCTEDSVLYKLSLKQLEQIIKIINTKKKNKII